MTESQDILLHNKGIITDKNNFYACYTHICMYEIMYVSMYVCIHILKWINGKIKNELS